MITVIENKNFIEAIFLNKEEAEMYLQEHPQIEACILKEMRFSEFPFYIAEVKICELGEFIYFSAKDELLNYIKSLNIDNISRTYCIHTEKNMICIFTKEKAPIRTLYPIDENNEDEIEEELSFTIYKINKPFTYDKKNEDRMGSWDHYHINEKMIDEIKKGNEGTNWQLIWK
ncbi:MAG: hypothetical protein LBH25_10455 [Fibromonadaceae bacterium]|jgi:hypothetical protein|nr:hypothetical protein [Fibromonadaceae bacterium]